MSLQVGGANDIDATTRGSHTLKGTAATTFQVWLTCVFPAYCSRQTSMQKSYPLSSIRPEPPRSVPLTAKIKLQSVILIGTLGSPHHVCASGTCLYDLGGVWPQSQEQFNPPRARHAQTSRHHARYIFPSNLTPCGCFWEYSC